jgi:catalase
MMDIAGSPALSIVLNGPKSFKGRKLGILVSDGVDAGLVAALQKAAEAAGAVVELVAPMVGGVEARDGSWIEAKQKIDGGPSVLYDAVAILVSDEGVKALAKEATARDFVADAFAHLKFIAHVAAAKPLLDKAGVMPDNGVITLGAAKDAKPFIEACGQLRFWPREASVKQF